MLGYTDVACVTSSKFCGSEFVRRHIANMHEKEVADAIRQAAAAVLKESTPAKTSSMARQVPQQVPEAVADSDMGKRAGQENSGPSAPPSASPSEPPVKVATAKKTAEPSADNRVNHCPCRPA